jgi:hypothetical protein
VELVAALVVNVAVAVDCCATVLLPGSIQQSQ